MVVELGQTESSIVFDVVVVVVGGILLLLLFNGTLPTAVKDIVVEDCNTSVNSRMNIE